MIDQTIFSLKIHTSILEVIERAAKLKGVSRNKFIIQAAEKQAKKINKP